MAEPMAKGSELRGGRYVIVGLLGEGTQGATLDAVDKREGRAVAIKRFEVRGARSWKDVELAEREARVLGALSHPGLPAYVEHFEEDGSLYLVMERIEGTSVAALRARGRARAFSGDDVIRMLRDVGATLGYLHGRTPPVIHRDVKPGNVLRRDDGSYALVDFGAVRDRLRPDGGSTVVGTFGYMAPEQFQGRATAGTDVYALGATALAMLSGEEPETLPHVGLAIDVEGALRGMDLPRGLREALRRMTEPNPDARPASVAIALAGLEPRKETKEAKRPPRPEPRVERGAKGWSEALEAEQRLWAERFESDSRRWAEELSDAAVEWAQGAIEPGWNRRARRKREKARRREQRERDRRSRRPTWHGVPFPASVVMRFGLVIARLVVVLATQIAVPTLLVLLSLLFGGGLRRAAASVRHGGRGALRGLADADAWVRGLPSGDAPPPIRARVADPEAEADDEDEVVEAEVVDEDEDERRR